MADYEVKGTLQLDTKQFDTAVQNAVRRLETLVGNVNGLKSGDTVLDGLNKDLTVTDVEANKAANSVKNAERQMKGLATTTNQARATNTQLTSSFGLASKSARNFNSTLSATNRLMRTLKTTGSIIFGMYAYQFVDAITQSAAATVKAKSEMESYFRALKMTTTEQKSFDRTLDSILKKYPKMNKYQLGETLTSLGTEFNLNVQQMEKIGNVAPMIINEYLRAGRKTEEAILAIKDISQGEFLRLSRETGVGQAEIKAAGWSGDLQDIEGLYTALEKVGKARHWDVIAQKATSLNDVMLITENRFGEFATDLVGRITPSIVGSFNAMIDAMNWLQSSWNSLGAGGQAVALIGGGLIGITAAVDKLYGVMANFATVRAANLMGINAEIAANEGLSRALAETTYAEEMEALAVKHNIESQFAQTVAIQESALARQNESLAVEQAIMAKTKHILSENEELSISEAVDMAIEKLTMARERETQAMYRQELIHQELIERGLIEEEVIIESDAAISRDIFMRELQVDKIRAQQLALEAEALTMETGMSIEEARIALMERENIANMSVAKTIATKIFGLEAETVANQGLIVGLYERLAASPLIVTAYTTEEVAAMGAAGASAALLASLLPIIAVAAAIAIAVAPLIINFNNLSASFDKVSDSLANGQAKIDELKTKQEGYKKTIDELSSKTNLSAKETDRLNEAREGLKYTTDALKAAEEEYAYATRLQTRYTTTVTKVEGQRYENLKKINEELNKNKGTQGQTYVDNTYGMGTAARESVKMQEILAYQEDKRLERNKQLNKELDNAKKSHEDIVKFNQDWNDTYTDREIAMQKMADPNTSGFDKLGAYWDNFWASAKLSWIEFWADPFRDVPRLQEAWSGFESDFNDTLTQLGNDWDSFWQPLSDSLNSFSIGGDWNPFKDWNIESTKQWVNDGFNYSLGDVTTILAEKGVEWFSLGILDGKKTVEGIKQGLANLKSMLEKKWNEAKSSLTNAGNTLKTQAYNAGKGIYDKFKSGIGSIAKIVQDKMDEVVQKIRNAKDDIAKAASDAASAAANPFSWIHIPGFGANGAYGARTGGNRNVKRINTPAYGPSDSFEGALRGILTARGFRNPGSYQFYPNSQKTVGETWNDGAANCFDGAKLILGLGQMFGLRGHMVLGSYNGMGHAAAMVGGKLYDMTQFQKHGRFRGTQGVYFGSQNTNSYGTTNNDRRLIVNVDLSNSTIYGVDDLDNRIKSTSEKVYYELNSPDKARGY